MTATDCALRGYAALRGGLRACARQGVPNAQSPIVLVSGRVRPNLPMVPFKWYRWRLLFSATNAILQPRVPIGCTAQLLATDGVYLPNGHAT